MLGKRLVGSRDEGTDRPDVGGVYVEQALQPRRVREGLSPTNGMQGRGQNRIREIRPSGIVGGLVETWTKVELGTRCTTERVQVGNSPLKVARVAFLSRHPHAACDVAGAGNGATAIPKRARRWKRRILPRSCLRVTAPVLDPTRRTCRYTHRSI